MNGMLERLELGTKIEYFIIPNLLNGYKLDFFINLETRTKFKENDYYSNPFYMKFNEKTLKEYIMKNTLTLLQQHQRHHDVSDLMKNISVNVKYLSNDQKTFIMITKYTKLETSHGRNSSELFNSVMYMLNDIRNCAMDVESMEIEKDEIYNNFIRMREDSYYFAPFLLDSINLTNSMATTYWSKATGYCDKWYVIDRKFMNALTRKYIEDYYLQHNYSIWEKNSEYLIKIIVDKENIPIQIIDNFCMHPISLVRSHNDYNWSLSLGSTPCSSAKEREFIKIPETCNNVPIPTEMIICNTLIWHPNHLTSNYTFKVHPIDIESSRFILT